jgi:hypothetical protein
MNFYIATIQAIATLLLATQQDERILSKIRLNKHEFIGGCD